MTPELIERALELATIEQLGKAMARKRNEDPEKRGGRPRNLKVKRCPCGQMTLKRAKARGHHCVAS